MRKYSRIQFDTEAQIELPDGVIAARILDISMKGVLLELPEGAAAQMESFFILNIPLQEGVSNIHMKAVLRHQEGSRIGCEWVGIDLDSMTNLRRLLELNIADNTMLERELAQLCHG